MEFGANLNNGVLYEAEMRGDSQEDYEEFLAKVNEWLQRRSLVLGEGTIKVMHYSEGTNAYRLTAPRVSGPSEYFVERISR